MIGKESVQFFDLLSEFFSKLLPIAGVIVLIALAFLLWEVIKLVRGLDTTINKVNDTISTVDKSVEKLQAPLNTVESISYTIDTVHFASKKAVNKSVDKITENYAIIKDWVATFFEDDKKDEKVKEKDFEVTEVAAVKVREED